jgi:protein O-GlcNAc transferase
MAQLTLQQVFDLAVKHHQAGRLQEAEQTYRQILARWPNHPDTLYNLGLLARQVGRNDAAVDLLRRAIAGKPDWAEAHCHLGHALIGKEQLDERIAAYARAVALKPSYAEAHTNLGIALVDKQELDEAIAAFRHAVACVPDSPEFQMNLGNALMAHGKLAEAVAAFRQAIVLRPNFAEAHNNFGNAMLALGRPGDAIAAMRQAIAYKPAYSEAHNNLGNALKDQGQLEEAIAAYRRAISLRPDYAEAHSNLIYAMHLHPSCDAKSIVEEHRRWNTQHAEPLKQFIPFHTNDRSPERRLRIGYVSPDFFQHPVGRFLLPLLEHHDKNQVQIFAYSQVQLPDAMTQRLRLYSDQWRNIVGLSDAQTADLVQQDQIDILVDLTMHTAGNRLLVFAHKPAPVQVTYLAYCSSTGLETIDYRLSDPYLDPPGGDESSYSERTVRLPETYWCYQPGTFSLEINSLPGSGPDHIVFACLNNFCKVNEQALKCWIEILKAVPNSQLLLHAHQGSHRQRVRERFGREGIEPNRVRFEGSLPLSDYFRLYHGIDIALDTFPYGGGTTTCDALWMGVPVISLVGNTAVGRGGLSILTNAGLPKMAARSREEYVRLAIELANDIPRLRNLRLSLRQRMQDSPLMDAPRFARHVEQAYRQMWRTWCKTTASHS